MTLVLLIQDAQTLTMSRHITPVQAISMDIDGGVIMRATMHGGTRESMWVQTLISD